jgi:hypothetical protein
MQTNRDNCAAAIEQREADHELYLTRDTEHSDSIDSCEEALELVKQLKNQPEGSATLMQTRSVNKALETIAHHFASLHGAKNKYTSMLEMLVELPRASLTRTLLMSPSASSKSSLTTLRFPRKMLLRRRAMHKRLMTSTWQLWTYLTIASRRTRRHQQRHRSDRL